MKKKQKQFLFWVTELSYGKVERHWFVFDCPKDVKDINTADAYLESMMKDLMDKNSWDVVLDFKPTEIGYNLKTPKETRIIKSDTKAIIQPKKNETYLLENNGLVTESLLKWVSSFDKNYKEINTSSRVYMRRNDLWFFASLINPRLERVVTSSAFETIMPHEASVSFGKKNDIDRKMFMQIEYFTWLMYEAVGFRKHNNIQSLNIEINYQGIDFIKDLKKGKLGEDSITYLKLMLRQSEGHVKINVYEKYKLKYTLITEEDLKL